LSSDSNLIVTHHPFKFYETWEEEFESELSAFSKTAGVKSSATTTPLILLLSLKWSAHPAGSHSSLFSKIYFLKR
ncbi:hypothetical protein, partial [Mycoplasmopsis bovis]|uniref:hypothetical protein n=1 Tax=Mycoplasmopsis bovis TaxID=28903 RepID=UPI003D27DF32